MHFHIITLFPKAFDSYLGESIMKRAIEDGKVKVSFYNPRDFTDDKWARVDRRPYGGGPGMVLEAESVLRAIAKAKGRKKASTIKVIFFAPHGRQFDTKLSDNYATKYQHMVLICGRYEGVDARVQKITKAETVSIGPYTLTGGELPAMIVMDSVSRRIKGVLGNETSVEERRTASAEVYTRPAVLSWKGKKHRVPSVLISGDHKKIEAWKDGLRKKTK